MTTVHDEMISDEELEEIFGAEEPLGVSERQLMTSLIHRMTGEGTKTIAIGPYELGRRLGEGAMGVVYETHDSQLDRDIAIKVLRRQPSEGDAHSRKNSLRESETMAEVAHRNIVHVYKVGFDSGQAWIAMELVKGKTLREWLHDFEGSWKEVLNIYVQAGRGIVAAHERGIVHGDLKPDNILIGDDDVPKVTDFGLAVANAESETVGGTPEYMAPEQYLDGGRSMQSDQYSFCVALFEGLTERHPYARRSFDEFASTSRAKDPETTAQMIRQRYRREIFVNANRGRLYWPRSQFRLPSRIRRAIARGLDPRPDRRFGSMVELLAKLDLVGLRRKRNGALAAVVVVAVVGMGGTLVGQRMGHNQRARECASATQSYDEVWNDEVRAQLLQEYSETTATRMGDVIEVHRERWLTAHRQACDATLMKDERDAWAPISACLEQRLDVVEYGLRSLDPAPAKAFNQIGELGAASPAACILDGNALAPTVPEEHEDRIAFARAALAEARVDEITRRFTKGLATVERQISEARDIGYQPLLAEAYYQRARLRIYRTRYETKERKGRNSPGFDDLTLAETHAALSFHHSTVWDIAIFRAKALAVLGASAAIVDFDALLAGKDADLLLREQRAEILEQRGLSHHNRALAAEDAEFVVAELLLAIEAFDGALEEQKKRGYEVGQAKVRGNMARTYIELGNRQEGDASDESDQRAIELVEETMSFWGGQPYGRAYLVDLWAQSINAAMTKSPLRARAVMTLALEQLADSPRDSAKILMPGILAFSRTPEALKLAERAMHLLPRVELPPSLEDQLRIVALGALVYDPTARDHLDQLREWSDELDERLVDLATRLPSRRILAHAYLGRAQLLLGDLREARASLQGARDDHFWDGQTDITRAEILLDLSEVYLELRDLPSARQAHEEASPLIRRDDRAPTYIKEVLAPRHDELADELASG